jgi:hypothetical protein
MMEEIKPNLTLSEPATYQIKVPGEIDVSWSDWFKKLIIKVEVSNDGPPITTLTCAVDQAALQGLLRRLYSLGLPLISVIWIEDR